MCNCVFGRAKVIFFSWNILSFSGILRSCQTSRDEAERKVEPSKHQSRTQHWWGSKCRNELGCCWVYSFWHKSPYLSQFFNVFRQWSLLTVAEYLFLGNLWGLFWQFFRLVDYFSLSLSHHLDFVLFANLIFMASTDREVLPKVCPVLCECPHLDVNIFTPAIFHNIWSQNISFYIFHSPMWQVAWFQMLSKLFAFWISVFFRAWSPHCHWGVKSVKRVPQALYATASAVCLTQSSLHCQTWYWPLYFQKIIAF